MSGRPAGDRRLARRAIPSGGEVAGAPDYLKEPLAGFLDLVASDEPAPGGGAVAAVAVSLAAGLCAMSARLSTGQLSDAPELVERAERLRRRVAPLAQEDSTAYGRVLAAHRAPADGGDPEAHRERIGEALSGAADVPLSVAEAGAEVATVAARLAREGNPNLRGDAIAATLVRINTAAGGISDDRPARADELVSEAVGAARRAAEGNG